MKEKFSVSLAWDLNSSKHSRKCSRIGLFSFYVHVFQGFNKEMEEISKLQRGYSVPDFELREGLKRDNKEYILPKYYLFYDRYSKISFLGEIVSYHIFTMQFFSSCQVRQYTLRKKYGKVCQVHSRASRSYDGSIF